MFDDSVKTVIRDRSTQFAGLLLAACIVLGGSSRPFSGLFLGLLSLPVLFLVVRDGRRPGRFEWVVLALLMLALLQLVPLPYSIWEALPSRDVGAGILDVAGVARGARPMTLDPSATAISLAMLLPSLVLFAWAARAGRPAIVAMLVLVVALAGAGLVLGLFQVSTKALYLRDTAHAGAATGFFTNRNHHALFLLLATVAIGALLPANAGPRWRAIALTGAVVFAVAVVTTTSRAGLLLAPVALAIAGAAILRTPRWMIPGALVAAFVVMAGLSQVGAVRTVMDRFDTAGEDGRIDIARDTWVAIGTYWPVGSGFGTFVPVYAGIEDLDRVSRNFVVHAHNDFLEIMLEGGLLGVAAIVAMLAAMAYGVVMLWRDRDRLAGCMLGVMMLTLIHSMVDFPLRMPAVAAVFAVAAGVVLNHRRKNDRDQSAVVFNS